MKKLHLCFITDTWYPLLGGGTTVLTNYIIRLRQNYNCTIELITRNIYTDGPLARISGVSITKLGPVSSWNNIFGRALFLINAYLYLTKRKYDLIHAFPYLSGLPAVLAGRKNHIPVVYSIFALHNPPSFLEKFFSFSIPYNQILTDNLNLFQKHRQLKNLKYLPAGIDVRNFDKVKVSVKEKNRILYVGRFHQQKGVDFLLNAAALLKTRIPDFKLVLIGYGPQEKHLHDLSKYLKLTKNVIFKKPLTGRELIKEYKKSQFLVIPSLFEGQALVILEAWAAKIPLVATNVSSMSTYIKERVNGLLVEPGNAFSLYHKLYQMLTDKHSHKLGEKGYQLAKKDFTWDRTISDLYSTYLKLTK